MKKNRKRALITGITGQDGALLAKSLTAKGIEVSGTFRRGSGNNFWRLNELEISDKINLYEHSIGNNPIDLSRVIQQKFDYIFHLAGDSFTQDSFRHPYQTINTNLTGSLEILDAVLQHSKESKVFIACSSEIFGNSKKIRSKKCCLSCKSLRRFLCFNWQSCSKTPFNTACFFSYQNCRL